MDKFNIEAVDLGQVFKIRVRHNNSMIGADWYLDQVEVLDVETEEVYMFLCERWLSTKKEDKRIDRTFYVKVVFKDSVLLFSSLYVRVIPEKKIDSCVYFVPVSGVWGWKKLWSIFQNDCSGQTGTGQECQQEEKEEKGSSGWRGSK